MNPTYAEADLIAKRCLERMLYSFPGRPKRLLGDKLCEWCDGSGDVHSIDGEFRGECVCSKKKNYPLIGLELEIKWSSFFPELYERFLSNGRTYQDLPGADALELSRLTTLREQELSLAEKFQTVLDCGMLKGRDSYWEHIFPPTTDPEVMRSMIAILAANGLLPSGKHIIQFTVGSVKPGKILYFALIALELVAADTTRILSAFHPSEPIKPYSWARKGRGGIFIKTDWDLKHESTACELRTLQLDTTPVFSNMEVINLTFNIMKGVVDLQQEIQSPEANALMQFYNAAEQQLVYHGLPNYNWEKPNTQPEIWQNYARALPQMCIALDEELEQLYSL